MRQAFSAQCWIAPPAASDSGRGEFGCRPRANCLPGNLMLETTLARPAGWLICRDSLLMGPWHNTDERSRTHRRSPTDYDAEHCLLRTVKCVSGTVDLSLNCEPVFDYGAQESRWSYDGPGYGEVVAKSDDGDVQLRPDDEPAGRHRGSRRPGPVPASPKAMTSSLR